MDNSQPGIFMEIEKSTCNPHDNAEACLPGHKFTSIWIFTKFEISYRGKNCIISSRLKKCKWGDGRTKKVVVQAFVRQVLVD